MNSGIMPNLSRSSGWTSLEQLARACVSFFDLMSAPKPIGFWPMRLLDDVLEPDERAAADEEDVRRVDLQELLLRVLAAALGRHVARSCPR